MDLERPKKFLECFSLGINPSLHKLARYASIQYHARQILEHPEHASRDELVFASYAREKEKQVHKSFAAIYADTVKSMQMSRSIDGYLHNFKELERLKKFASYLCPDTQYEILLETASESLVEKIHKELRSSDVDIYDATHAIVCTKYDSANKHHRYDRLLGKIKTGVIVGLIGLNIFQACTKEQPVNARTGLEERVTSYRTRPPQGTPERSLE